MSSNSQRMRTSTRQQGVANAGPASISPAAAMRRALLLSGGLAAAAAAGGAAWWARTRPAATPSPIAFAPAAPLQTDPFANVPARSAANAPAAPDFTAATTNGGKFTLSAQRGKPVLLLFTAGWCTTCIPEIQKLAKLHAEEARNGLV